MTHKLTQFERYLAPTGRILIGLFFFMAGVSKIGGLTGLTSMIAGAGLPVPMLLAVLTIALEIGGGLMLITGFYGRYAALALATFTFIVSFPFHGPAMWGENPMQKIMFMKNIAIFGSLLFMTAHIGKAAIKPEEETKLPTPTL